MKKEKIKKVSKKVLSTLLVLLLAFIVLEKSGLITKAQELFNKGEEQSSDTQTIIVEEDGKQMVTEVEVKTVFKSIGEIYSTESTVSNFYKDVKYPKVFGKEIKSNKLQSEVTYIYKATVIAGFNVDDIDVDIKGNTITVTLPKKCILSATDVEVTKSYESDHWYNQIDAENVLADYDEMQAKAIKQAKADGIEEVAKADFVKVASSLLSVFEKQGYEIVVK